MSLRVVVVAVGGRDRDDRDRAGPARRPAAARRDHAVDVRDLSEVRVDRRAGVPGCRRRRSAPRRRAAAGSRSRAGRMRPASRCGGAARCSSSCRRAHCPTAIAATATRTHRPTTSRRRRNGNASDGVNMVSSSSPVGHVGRHPGAARVVLTTGLQSPERDRIRRLQAPRQRGGGRCSSTRDVDGEARYTMTSFETHDDLSEAGGDGGGRHQLHRLRRGCTGAVRPRRRHERVPVVTLIAQLPAAGRRYIALDLPLHGQSPVREDQDLSLAGLADTVSAFCEAAELGPVDLVAHDTGGAVAQIFAAREPERLASLTLTNCETHDNVPPAAFKPVVEQAKAGTLAPTAPALLADLEAARAAVFGSGYENPAFIDLETVRGYLEPLIGSPERACSSSGCSPHSTHATCSASSRISRSSTSRRSWRGATADELRTALGPLAREMIPGVRHVVEVPGAKLFFPDERADELRSVAHPALGGGADARAMTAPTWDRASVRPRRGEREAGRARAPGSARHPGASAGCNGPPVASRSAAAAPSMATEPRRRRRAATRPRQTLERERLRPGGRRRRTRPSSASRCDGAAAGTASPRSSAMKPERGEARGRDRPARRGPNSRSHRLRGGSARPRRAGRGAAARCRAGCRPTRGSARSAGAPRRRALRRTSARPRRRGPAARTRSRAGR